MTALPKDFKLIKKSDFLNVYNSNARAIKTKHFIFLVKDNTQQKTRLGVVVRKKIFKQAVKRNYIRRVMNSLFIQDQKDVGHIDIVTILSRPIKLNFEEIKQDWKLFLRKLILSDKK
ncbi:MAG: ribonuclease P protein component [Pseudomonadota bacterium]|nr:ribonuclease P protein component [Pseudomonadota bacterium]